MSSIKHPKIVVYDNKPKPIPWYIAAGIFVLVIIGFCVLPALY